MASSKGIWDHEGGREERANAFRCYYCNVYSAEPADPTLSGLCNDTADVPEGDALRFLITDSLPLRSCSTGWT
jgi:hypothetical protein